MDAIGELSEQVECDEAELARLVNEWRNYKSGWINGAFCGFVAGAAAMFSLFAFA